MIKRAAFERLENLAGHFPVVMVCGARQTGKTTLLKCFSENKEINYVTLDYPNIRQLAKNDPELFLQQYKTPLFIDEIQYAPELLPFIKINVDKNNNNGQYFLTGSQMFYAMKNVSESLAGRVGILILYSLSYSEIIGKVSKPFLNENMMLSGEQHRTVSEVFEQIYRGGMPKLIADKNLSVEDYFGSYMQTYLERDIRDLIKIKDETKFIKFISSVAARTSQELNLSDISKDVGVDAKTAESWLSILASSGIVFLLQPFSGSTIKRIVKRPKLYFMDTGLACYLSLWNNPRTLELSAMAGAFFENYVISELVKSYSNGGIDVRSRFCYYRDNNSNEIDLLIIQNGKIYPIEIKKSANPTIEAIKNFSVVSSLNMEAGNGTVFCMAKNVFPLDRMNSLVPIDEI